MPPAEQEVSRRSRVNILSCSGRGVRSASLASREHTRLADLNTSDRWASRNDRGSGHVALKAIRTRDGLRAALETSVVGNRKRLFCCVVFGRALSAMLVVALQFVHRTCAAIWESICF